MFGMKAPLKFMIVKSMGEGSVMDAKSLYRQLQPLYGTERQFSRKSLENHLQSLKAVGIVEVADARFEDGGELAVSYRLTPFGLEKLAGL